MLNAYIQPKSTITKDKDLIVLDAGGSNIRVALVSFDSKKGLQKKYYKKYDMLGIDSPLSKEEFFAALYDLIEPIIEKSNRISFCFSYPCDISPKQDGKLLYWTKEIKAPEVEGLWIGKTLNEFIMSRGHQEKKITLLNDTTATLLAGQLEDFTQTKTDSNSSVCDGLVGLILGTGTNCAYYQSGESIFNMESGAFDGILNTPIDISFDANCSDPNTYPFEKKIAGRYLGDLFLTCLKQACSHQLFSESCSAHILKIKTFSSQMLSETIEKNNTVLFGAKPEDHKEIIKIAEALVKRAAKLTAIHIAAAAIQTEGGQQANTQVCINIDGSTYYGLYGFRSLCEWHLQTILSKLNIRFVLRNIDDAPLVGTAIAAL